MPLGLGPPSLVEGVERVEGFDSQSGGGAWFPLVIPFRVEGLDSLQWLWITWSDLIPSSDSLQGGGAWFPSMIVNHRKHPKKKNQNTSHIMEFKKNCEITLF